MTDRDKETLRRQLSQPEIQHRYQQAINYFVNGSKTGLIDKSEYKLFQEYNVKTDLSAAAHAWFSMVINWDEYFNLVQAIIGFDLMVQGIISGQIKAKGNGENKDENFIPPNQLDDTITYEKEE